jgi:hypothetical protein
MLLTLGDSFTVKRYDGDVPWPEVLSEMLGKELLNISAEGVSNHWMFRNMVWALQERPDISLVVVSLTNWDRVEFPYDDYAKKDIGFGHITKSIKPKQVLTDEPHPINRTYASYYSTLYFIDTTASYILAMSELAEKRNIPIIFIQPLVPFNNLSASKKVKFDAIPHNFKTNFTKEEEKYIENFSLIQSVNKNLFTKFDLTLKSILYMNVDNPQNHKGSLRSLDNNERGQDYESLYHYFITWHPEYQMGYHARDIYKGGQKHKDVWDAHPNKKGHKMVAKIVFDHYNKIPKNLQEYYGD